MLPTKAHHPSVDLQTYKAAYHIPDHKHGNSKQTLRIVTGSVSDRLLCESISDLQENQTLRNTAASKSFIPHAITHSLCYCHMAVAVLVKEQRGRSRFALDSEILKPLTCFLSFCAGGSKALERSAIFCQKWEKKMTLICKWRQAHVTAAQLRRTSESFFTAWNDFCMGGLHKWHLSLNPVHGGVPWLFFKCQSHKFPRS